MSRGQVELPGVTRKPRDSRYDKRLVAADVVQVAERDREVDLFLLLRGTDAITKRAQTLGRPPRRRDIVETPSSPS